MQSGTILGNWGQREGLTAKDLESEQIWASQQPPEARWQRLRNSEGKFFPTWASLPPKLWFKRLCRSQKTQSQRPLSQGLLKAALQQNEEQSKEDIPRSGARKATPHGTKGKGTFRMIAKARLGTLCRHRWELVHMERETMKTLVCWAQSSPDPLQPHCHLEHMPSHRVCSPKTEE